MSHWFYITPDEYVQAAEYGITSEMLDRRVRAQGWPKLRAMTTPPRKVTDRSKWRSLADKNGIKYATFMNRINNLGWSEERAATTPLETAEEIKKHALMATNHIRVYPVQYVQLAERNGIPYPTFRDRVKKGWDYERAATEPIWSRQQTGRLGAQRLREREGDWAAEIFKKRRSQV